MKTCTKCGAEKPLAEYHRDRRARDGHMTQCKPCTLARRAEYYRENRERSLESHRAYYVATRDDRREYRITYGAAYRAANPHRGWEQRYRRRARRFGFEPVIESFTRAELIARYGDACVHCGGPFEQLDHYPVPVALGGPHSLDNAVPSCAACNVSQGREMQTALGLTRGYRATA